MLIARTRATLCTVRPYLTMDAAGFSDVPRSSGDLADGRGRNRGRRGGVLRDRRLVTPGARAPGAPADTEHAVNWRASRMPLASGGHPPENPVDPRATTGVWVPCDPAPRRPRSWKAARRPAASRDSRGPVAFVGFEAPAVHEHGACGQDVREAGDDQHFPNGSCAIATAWSCPLLPVGGRLVIVGLAGTDASDPRRAADVARLFLARGPTASRAWAPWHS